MNEPVPLGWSRIRNCTDHGPGQECYHHTSGLVITRKKMTVLIAEVRERKIPGAKSRSLRDIVLCEAADVTQTKRQAIRFSVSVLVRDTRFLVHDLSYKSDHTVYRDGDLLTCTCLRRKGGVDCPHLRSTKSYLYEQVSG